MSRASEDRPGTCRSLVEEEDNATGSFQDHWLKTDKKVLPDERLQVFPGPFSLFSK